MGWRFERRDGEKILRLIAEDHMTVDDVLAQAHQGIEIVNQDKLDGGLVDYSRAVLGASLYDIFKLPDLFDLLSAPRTAKVAVILPSDAANMHKYTFFDDVANNRGYMVKLFWEPTTAMAWLTDVERAIAGQS